MSELSFSCLLNAALNGIIGRGNNIFFSISSEHNFKEDDQELDYQERINYEIWSFLH